ncbi:hypothetical protein NUW58_g3672 [Xylaria curta]|uniref:Uncharacterized protein n=1 Tax=Xylaria curta TaxID=42375 RepID=A0ACC1PBI9_9PEZI|nr:hypothetical protein NUW58_g3672 [Xylaria curta]
MGVDRQLQANVEAECVNEPESSSDAVIKVPSPGVIAFTPINRAGSVATEHRECNNVPPSTTPVGPKTTSGMRRKRMAECNKASAEKKLKITTNSSGPTSTKPLPITPTQTSASSHSLKGKEPMVIINDHNFAQIDDVNYFLAPSDYVVSYRRSFQAQGSSTTIGQSTPHILENEAGLLLTPTEGTPSRRVLGGHKDTHSRGVSATPHTGASNEGSDLSDAYPLDDDIADDDIVQLLAGPLGLVQENHIPPSSVQGWDHDSRSAAEYDPNLKYSPPKPQKLDSDTVQMEHIPTSWQRDASEDLLDEDVDWNAVLVNANAIQTNPSLYSQPGTEVFEHVNTEIRSKKPHNAGPHSDPADNLTAFIRPPFPEKVRDRPSVSGMSSNTLLRTCFRIGAMISQTVHCYNHQQDVVFELYARVTYSSRETLVRKQHFQFVDLYKDQQPYPAATLTNWRIDSQSDKESSVFLDTTGGPRLCWCMCKPMRDSKAAIGWTYTVLKIKEIDRERINWAKRVICGDLEKLSAETTAAKL